MLSGPRSRSEGLPATKIDFDLTRHMVYIGTRGVDGPNLIHGFDEGHVIAQDVLDSIVWRHLEG